MANRILIRFVKLLEDCESRASLDLTSIDRHKGCCEGNQPSTMCVDEQQAVFEKTTLAMRNLQTGDCSNWCSQVG